MVAPIVAAAAIAAASQLLKPKYEDEGAKLNRDIYGNVSNVQLPSDQELTVKLQQLIYQGDITPEQAQTIYQQASGMQNVQGSPEAKSAQMQALAQLQGIAGQGGLTSEDKANLNDIQTQIGSQQRGAREAILQNANERGMGNSGTALMNELLSQQAGATNANSQGLDVAKMAQQRALQAMQQSGQLGGQIENQQFGEQTQKASAQDAINRFNAANSQDVVNANTLARNQAQFANLANRQELSNANVGIVNQQAELGAQAKQQAFQNAMQKATGGQASANALSNAAQNQYAMNTAYTGGTLGAVGNVLASSNNSVFQPKKTQQVDKDGNPV